MTFVEKVTRWLTNIQVKIKSEVAASNTQTQGIVDAIDQLEKRCDAVESPSPDKEARFWQLINLVYTNQTDNNKQQRRSPSKLLNSYLFI